MSEHNQWTTQVISELITPFNWQACRTIFPLAAANFIFALNMERTLLKSENQEALIEQARVKTQYALEAIETVKRFIEETDIQTRTGIFEPAKNYYESLHDHPDLQGKLPHFDLLSYTYELEQGIQQAADNLPRKSVGHPRNDRAHAICKSLAVIYALFTGEKPTCNKPRLPYTNWGAYGNLLVRILERAGERIQNPEAMSKEYLNELTPEKISKLRETQTVYLFDDRMVISLNHITGTYLLRMADARYPNNQTISII